jgi:hypothetical protein
VMSAQSKHKGFPIYSWKSAAECGCVGVQF